MEHFICASTHDVDAQFRPFINEGGKELPQEIDRNAMRRSYRELDPLLTSKDRERCKRVIADCLNLSHVLEQCST